MSYLGAPCRVRWKHGVPALKLSKNRTLRWRPDSSAPFVLKLGFGNGAHTLSSRGTVVPPLCRIRKARINDDPGSRRLSHSARTVTRTTLRPARCCLWMNSLTRATSLSSVVGGGCVAKYRSAEKVCSSVCGDVAMADLGTVPMRWYWAFLSVPRVWYVVRCRCRRA